MKSIIALGLALTMALSMAACSSKPAETSVPTETTVITEAPTEAPAPSVEEALNSLKSILGDSYGCSAPVEREQIIGYYGLDDAKVEDCIAEENAVSSVFMDKAVILKVADGYADEAAACLQNGFDQTIHYARMYSMDLFRLGEARLFVDGNYVALLVLGNPGDGEANEEALAKLAAEEGLKVDSAWENVFGHMAENRMVIPEEQESHGGLIPGGRG